MKVPELLDRMADIDLGVVPLEKLNLIALTNIYLFASYAYYVKDCSLISDGTFDKLCKFLYDSYEFMEGCGVRGVDSVILEGNLQAGTCIGMVYPQAVIDIAEQMISLKQMEDL